ncbi:MAG: hypothetical protein ABI824_05395 [Acidobacteriota bacterium]
MKIPISLAAACLGVTFFLAAAPQAPPPTGASAPVAAIAPGNRDLTTFTLFKDKQPTGIGAIQVMIKKLDANAQKYSVDIWVGTRHMEKKDIYAGEPIVFYAANDDQPHEFLVRHVLDDRLEGRLLSPRPLPPALPQP